MAVASACCPPTCPSDPHCYLSPWNRLLSTRCNNSFPSLVITRRGVPLMSGRGNVVRLLKTTTFVFVLTPWFFLEILVVKKERKKTNRRRYKSEKEERPKNVRQENGRGGGLRLWQLSQNWKSICKVDVAAAWYIRTKLTCKHHRALFPSCRRRWKLLPSVSCFSICCSI